VLPAQRANDETQPPLKPLGTPPAGLARGLRLLGLDPQHAARCTGPENSAQTSRASRSPVITEESLRPPLLRNADSLTKFFAKAVRKLGFPELRFHDLRGSHETLLLDAGVPVHVVAARCGHDPAVLLRSYAKRTRKADTSAAAVIGALAKNVLR
jgi:hypothetical protein